MKDTIYRQDAIDALQKEINKGIPPFDDVMGSIRCGVRLARNIIEDLPSAEPEIIYCKDCKKHNMPKGHYYNGKYIGVKECCPLVFVRGLAQGHEFDYQFCVWAERRTDERID